jgi:hypothetical protein
VVDDGAKCAAFVVHSDARHVMTNRTLHIAERIDAVAVCTRGIDVDTVGGQRRPREARQYIEYPPRVTIIDVTWPRRSALVIVAGRPAPGAEASSVWHHCSAFEVWSVSATNCTGFAIQPATSALFNKPA